MCSNFVKTPKVENIVEHKLEDILFPSNFSIKKIINKTVPTKKSTNILNIEFYFFIYKTKKFLFIKFYIYIYY